MSRIKVRSLAIFILKRASGLLENSPGNVGEKRENSVASYSKYVHLLLDLHISMQLKIFTGARNSLKTDCNKEFNSKGLSLKWQRVGKTQSKSRSLRMI